MPVKYVRDMERRNAFSGRRPPFIRLSETPRRFAKRHLFRVYLGLLLVFAVIYAGHYLLERNRYKDQPLEYGEGVIVRIETTRDGGLGLDIAFKDAQGATRAARADVRGAEWKHAATGTRTRLAFRRSRDGKAIRVETCALLP